MVTFTKVIGVKRERSSPNMIDNHRNGGTFTSVSLSFYDSSSSGGCSLRLLELIRLNIGLTNGNYLLKNLGCVILFHWLTIFAKLLIFLPLILLAASYSLEVLKLIIG